MISTRTPLPLAAVALGALLLLPFALQAAQTSPPAYLIRSGDGLNVQVLEHPEWSLQVTVRPDGRVSYPGLGEIQVAGLTIQELTERITLALGPDGRHLKNPQVVVNTTSMRPATVHVLGAVARPGLIELPQGQETAARVLLLAGGALPNANLAAAELNHADSSRQVFDLRAQLKAGAAGTVLHGGDVLVVPALEELSVGVLGAASRNGMFSLRPGETSISLQDLVLQVGGLNNNADKKRALVLRLDGTVEPIALEAMLKREVPAVTLAAGDMLWVLPEAETEFFVVTGAVNTPGRYDYRAGLTLADALALAGQPNQAAQTKEVSLIHKDGSKDVVNIRPMLEGQDTETARMAIKPDDIILVPVVHESYVVLGAVGRPGVMPWEENLRLSDALARAGGPVERVADMNHVILVRRTEGAKQPTVMELNAKDLLTGKNESANWVLQAGDTIYIPSTEEKDWRKKLEIPLFLMSIATTLNALF